MDTFEKDDFVPSGQYSHNNCYQRIPTFQPHTNSTAYDYCPSRIIYRKSYYIMSIETCKDFGMIRRSVPSIVALEDVLPFLELTQLNKQDNTNFNLLGGHVVESRDADMSDVPSLARRELSHCKTFKTLSLSLMTCHEGLCMFARASL